MCNYVAILVIYCLNIFLVFIYLVVVARTGGSRALFLKQLLLTLLEKLFLHRYLGGMVQSIVSRFLALSALLLRIHELGSTGILLPQNIILDSLLLLVFAILELLLILKELILGASFVTLFTVDARLESRSFNFFILRLFLPHFFNFKFALTFPRLELLVVLLNVGVFDLPLIVELLEFLLRDSDLILTITSLAGQILHQLIHKQSLLEKIEQFLFI